MLSFSGDTAARDPSIFFEMFNSALVRALVGVAFYSRIPVKKKGN